LPEKVLHIADQLGIFPANDGQTISRRMGIVTFKAGESNQSPFVLVKADAGTGDCGTAVSQT
jgi:hypothetical protein